MSSAAKAAPRHRAALRMIGVVIAAFVLGGIAAFAFAFRIAGWEKTDHLGGMAYRVPGAPGSFVQVEIVPLLTALGGGAIGLAAALGLTAWFLLNTIAAVTSGPQPQPTAPMPAKKPRRRLRFAVLGPVVLFAVLVALGGRWLAYVTRAETPFDAVGIGLNLRAPKVLRDWGCARLKARFEGKTLPPYGCGRPEDSRLWQ